MWLVRFALNFDQRAYCVFLVLDCITLIAGKFFCNLLQKWKVCLKQSFHILEGVVIPIHLNFL